MLTMMLETELEPVPIESWQEFIPVLKQKLTDIGYSLTEVIIRHYDGSRTELIKRTGTDRDENSELCDHPEDICHRWSPKPTDPTSITYARTLDLSQDPVRPKTLHGQPIDSIDNLDYLAHLPDTKCIAVYTQKDLRRVTQNEYHFIGNPRDALLAIFSVNGHKNSE